MVIAETKQVDIIKDRRELASNKGGVIGSDAKRNQGPSITYNSFADINIELVQIWP